jgi:hypothetical protein
LLGKERRNIYDELSLSFPCLLGLVLTFLNIRVPAAFSTVPRISIGHHIEDPWVDEKVVEGE